MKSTSYDKVQADQESTGQLLAERAGLLLMDPKAADTTVAATDAALALIATLRRVHPAMLLYQSGGCCEGSSPTAWAVGELVLGESDVQVGEVGGVPFHVSATQCGYLLGQALTLDAQRGHLGTFSLEEGSGWHFVTRTAACAHFSP